jgi:hypothetical protein
MSSIRFFTSGRNRIRPISHWAYWLSQALLELKLNEDQRNETFTYLLRDNNAKCDRVIRTLFNGSTVELDDWEVLCYHATHRIGELPWIAGDKQNAFA